MNNSDTNWFDNQTEQILTGLSASTFEGSIRAINELEARARIGFLGDSLERALSSCADLRLDAALCTHQEYDECEGFYLSLLALNVDARTQLIKATILAREFPGNARALERLADALARGRVEAPESLVLAAEALLVERPAD